MDGTFGLPTVRDIIAELEKPGRDPRPAFRAATFSEGIEKISDLRPGMVLEGTVTNVAAFGAFVDVGVHQDGLVHVSALANRFVSDPREVVKSGQVVRVKVLEADAERKRISLTLRLDDEPAPAGGRQATGGGRPGRGGSAGGGGPSGGGGSAGGGRSAGGGGTAGGGRREKPAPQKPAPRSPRRLRRTLPWRKRYGKPASRSRRTGKKSSTCPTARRPRGHCLGLEYGPCCGRVVPDTIEPGA